MKGFFVFFFPFGLPVEGFRGKMGIVSKRSYIKEYKP